MGDIKDHKLDVTKLIYLIHQCFLLSVDKLGSLNVSCLIHYRSPVSYISLSLTFFFSVVFGKRVRINKSMEEPGICLWLPGQGDLSVKMRTGCTRTVAMTGLWDSQQSEVFL